MLFLQKHRINLKLIHKNERALNHIAFRLEYIQFYRLASMFSNGNFLTAKLNILYI